MSSGTEHNAQHCMLYAFVDCCRASASRLPPGSQPNFETEGTPGNSCLSAWSDKLERWSRQLNHNNQSVASVALNVAATTNHQPQLAICRSRLVQHQRMKHNRLSESHGGLLINLHQRFEGCIVANVIIDVKCCATIHAGSAVKPKAKRRQSKECTCKRGWVWYHFSKTH